MSNSKYLTSENQIILIIGSAPEGYHQKRFEEKRDSCFANDKEYVGCPNGINEAMLKPILKNAFEKHTDKIHLYICTLEPIKDSNKTIKVGNYRISKEFLENCQKLAESKGVTLSIEYDVCKDLVCEEELGFEKVVQHTAILIGSAPEGKIQPKITEMVDFLASEKGGSYTADDILIIPHGADEKEFKKIMKLYSCEKMLFYICTETPSRDYESSVWCGGYELPKSLFVKNEKKGILDVQVIFDSCRGVVPYNRSIEDKALNVLEFLSKQFF